MPVNDYIQETLTLVSGLFLKDVPYNDEGGIDFVKNFKVEKSVCDVNTRSYDVLINVFTDISPKDFVYDEFKHEYKFEGSVVIKKAQIMLYRYLINSRQLFYQWDEKLVRNATYESWQRWVKRDDDRWKICIRYSQNTQRSDQSYFFLDEELLAQRIEDLHPTIKYLPECYELSVEKLPIPLWITLKL